MNFLRHFVNYALIAGLVFLAACNEKPKKAATPDPGAAIEKLTIRYVDEDSIMAQYNLVLAYYYGTGVEKDIQEARRWLELSSKQGFNLASRMLLKL